jgi:hypothetical protein
MKFKSFSLRWWWFGIAEDLYKAREKELHDLEEPEIRKGHGWETPKEQLPSGWFSVGMKSLLTKEKNKLTVFGPCHCTWESPQHIAIRSRYAGKIFQRYLSSIPHIIGVVGGLLGIMSFVLQCS